MSAIRQPALFGGGRVKEPRIETQLLALRADSPTFPIPVTELRFAAAIGRNWRFDYAWPDWKIALEIEGGIWGRQIAGADGKNYRIVQSRHTSGAGMTNDAEKYNHAAIDGWCVLRATDNLIRDGRALEHVLAAFRARGWKDKADATNTTTPEDQGTEAGFVRTDPA